MALVYHVFVELVVNRFHSRNLKQGQRQQVVTWGGGRAGGDLVLATILKTMNRMHLTLWYEMC
jgi:hypothetical protein